MSLADKLTAIRDGFAEQAPPEVLEVMHRATADLRASGILDRVSEPSDPAPEFGLVNQAGDLMTSEALLARGPVVLTFYRGLW